MTLNIDDNFDENTFLNNFSDNNLSQIVGNNEDDIQSVQANYNKTAAVKGLKSKQLETIDLNKLVLDSKLEEQKQTISRSQASTKNNDVQPKKLKAKNSDTDTMVLPHLHKHDLYKKMTYDKPSTWIWASYFTELGCLNSLNCMFKPIDYEFPHYQCGECEFQIWLDWAKYYAESLETVRFQHRTYYPVFHKHPVILDMGLERKSWACSGMGLPNNCLSSINGEALIGSKKWKWQQWNVQLWFDWLKRQDIEESCNNMLVHEHQLFKGQVANFFNRNQTVLCDAGERSVGISHDIDNEQKVLRCAPCNFNWCEECYKVIDDNQREEERAINEAGMLNKNITNKNITNLLPDQVVYVTIHPHPLHQVIDNSALCERVVHGQCVSIDYKSNFSEPKYFKWIKQDKWEFVLWALCTSQHVRRVKTVKKSGACIIF
jgi:hypothetical protein